MWNSQYIKHETEQLVPGKICDVKVSDYNSRLPKFGSIGVYGMARSEELTRLYMRPMSMTSTR